MYDYFGNRQQPYIGQYNTQNGAFTQRQEIARVSGENGAKAFQLPPNSSILLLDETNPLVWLKTTDSGGYPSLIPYSIAPYVPEQPSDTNNLVKRIETLEKQIGDVLNAKPDSTKSKQSSK